MPLVNAHAVTAHGVLDLVHDGLASRLYAQHPLRLGHVVGGGLAAQDAFHTHHSLHIGSEVGEAIQSEQ
jgi:hypothetical protein